MWQRAPGDGQRHLDCGRFGAHRLGRLIDVEADPAAQHHTVGAPVRELPVQHEQARVPWSDPVGPPSYLKAQFTPDLGSGAGLTQQPGPVIPGGRQ
ncbi:hypothetical protein Sfulv_17710 [Streptomyces fulvorobeus]|uniref:Uncharacterized protein n=1 Tax=Streptomyces fulvorobeus TaxID=284028 RepID=A0A7J0C3A1_9ACTN|nr:hypothetical protein Sfulv_17710 [Streptomyces fulvorobeus]